MAHVVFWRPGHSRHFLSLQPAGVLQGVWRSSQSMSDYTRYAWCFSWSTVTVTITYDSHKDNNIHDDMRKNPKEICKQSNMFWGGQLEPPLQITSHVRLQLLHEFSTYTTCNPAGPNVLSHLAPHQPPLESRLRLILLVPLITPSILFPPSAFTTKKSKPVGYKLTQSHCDRLSTTCQAA